MRRTEFVDGKHARGKYIYIYIYIPFDPFRPRPEALLMRSIQCFKSVLYDISYTTILYTYRYVQPIVLLSAACLRMQHSSPDDDYIIVFTKIS